MRVLNVLFSKFMIFGVWNVSYGDLCGERGPMIEIKALYGTQYIIMTGRVCVCMYVECLTFILCFLLLL